MCEYFLPFVLRACHFWQLLTVKDFEDVTAAKCSSLGSMRASPLLSARCPAPSTSGNNLVRAFDVIRGDFYLVFHVFVSAAVLFVAASHVSWKGYRLDALWFEREIWIISQFLFYREVIVFLLSSAKSMLNEHRENNGLYIGAYASRQSKWGMIQLYVKSYSHASYLLVIGLICMQMDCTY